MTRRNSILLLIVAVLGLSCERADMLPIAEEDIAFCVPSVEEGCKTRSGLVSGAIPAGGTFGVFGYCIPYLMGSDKPDIPSGVSAWDVKKLRAHADVFCNRTVTVQPDGNCSYPDPRIWYQKSAEMQSAFDFQYTFFGYSPASGHEKGGRITTTPDTETVIGIPEVTYVAPYSGTDVNALLDDSLMDDFMYASHYNMYRKEKFVIFRFKHVMTSLSIRLSNHNVKKAVEVKSLRLLCDGCYQNVTVDFDRIGEGYGALSYGPGRYSGTFSFLDAPQRLVVPSGQNRVDYTTKDILLITNMDPSQKAIAASLDLEITYNAGTGSDVVYKHAIGADFRPFPGIRYVLEINYVGTEFVVNILAENDEIWNNGGDSDMQIK